MLLLKNEERGNEPMRAVAIIPKRYWQHTNGQRASIYGASPWMTEKEKKDWNLITKGYTCQNSDGTVGCYSSNKWHTLEDVKASFERLGKPMPEVRGK